MDNINGISQIVKILQSKVSKNKETSRTGKTKSGAKDVVKPTTKRSIENLEIQISAKISSLDKKSSNYKHAAINVFVDEILDWEFSQNITADPNFSVLKEKIAAAFKENKSLDKGFEKILSQLEK